MKVETISDEEMAARKAQWERKAREPTPLPWRVVHDKQWDDKPQVSIVGANDDTVADDTQYYPWPIKAADAELIVRRVNAHDALVAALEAVKIVRYDPGNDDAWDQADAALALARGGK